MNKVTKDAIDILHARGARVRYMQQHEKAVGIDIFDDEYHPPEVEIVGDFARSEDDALRKFTDAVHRVHTERLDSITLLRTVAIYYNRNGYFASAKSVTLPRKELKL